MQIAKIFKLLNFMRMAENGIIICFNDYNSLKAPLLIYLTEDGIVNILMMYKNKKALPLIHEIDVGIDEHSPKVFVPIAVADGGMGTNFE